MLRHSLCIFALLGALAACDKSATSDDPDPPPATNDCNAAPTCDVETQCPAGLGCYALEACGEARCLSGEAACQAACGTSECAVMESHPMQINCG